MNDKILIISYPLKLPNHKCNIIRIHPDKLIDIFDSAKKIFPTYYFNLLYSTDQNIEDNKDELINILLNDNVGKFTQYKDKIMTLLKNINPILVVVNGNSILKLLFSIASHKIGIHMAYININIYNDPNTISYKNHILVDNLVKYILVKYKNTKLYLEKKNLGKQPKHNDRLMPFNIIDLKNNNDILILIINHLKKRKLIYNKKNSPEFIRQIGLGNKIASYELCKKKKINIPKIILFKKKWDY